ncbi:MAG: hypothetical protein PHN50_06280, partial [Bacteroidales bacterium]|nr:hypothetical protein [Bacteroidales bacterium]
MLKEQNTIIPFSHNTARLRPDSLIKLLFVLLCIQLGMHNVQAQKQPDSLVSLQVQNKAFGEVLENLYEQFGIKVAFNASDPIFNKTISYTADQVPVLEMLSSLLESEGYGYRKIGDQYNVYRLRINDKSEDAEPVEVFDVQQHRDTVFMSQQVIKTDTLIVL